jgi:hypothetical protein
MTEKLGVLGINECVLVDDGRPRIGSLHQLHVPRAKRCGTDANGQDFGP